MLSDLVELLVLLLKLDLTISGKLSLNTSIAIMKNLLNSSLGILTFFWLFSTLLQIFISSSLPILRFISWYSITLAKWRRRNIRVSFFGVSSIRYITFRLVVGSRQFCDVSEMINIVINESSAACRFFIGGLFTIRTDFLIFFLHCLENASDRKFKNGEIFVWKLIFKNLSFPICKCYEIFTNCPFVTTKLCFNNNEKGTIFWKHFVSGKFDENIKNFIFQGVIVKNRLKLLNYY